MNNVISELLHEEQQKEKRVSSLEKKVAEGACDKDL